jgi:LysR family transcriptional regulator of abg operon
MRLTQLRDFAAVATHRSLRAAARDLGIAQPSLTKSIQALEKELGASLFHRTSRGAELTPIGTAFLARTNLIMEEMRRAKEEVQQLTESDFGEVAFGISTAPTLMFLSRCLREFQRKFPNVKVRIVTGIFPVAIPELRDGRLDFAIVPRSDHDLGDQLIVEKLLDNSRVPICRKTHPLAKATKLAELTNASWVAASIDADPRAAFDRIFTQRGLTPPAQIIYCESTIGIIELLINMDTICWLPLAWLESEILSPWLTAVPIEEPAQKGQDICLIRRRNFPLTPAADYLATLFSRYCSYRSEPAPVAQPAGPRAKRGPAARPVRTGAG